MIRMETMDYKQELHNLHLLPQSFGDSISAIKIEGWASSGEFTEMVFEDEFIGNRMRPEWAMGRPKRRRLMGRTSRLPRNANRSRTRPLARGRWQQR